MKQKIYILLTILCMVGIFSFSARSGEVSSQDSYNVGMLVGHLAVPGFDGWGEEQQTAFAQKIDHPVRKTAHATEYAILAFFVFGAVGETSVKKRFFTSQAICTLYAVTDEVHQLFVPGRDGNPTDVLIDSAGAFVMLALLCLVAVKIIKSRR